MSRYRNIDVRIWNDERFTQYDPYEKLIWFALLTHPCMTPMGAGVIPSGALDAIIGNVGDYCFRCQDNCSKMEHRARGIINTTLNTPPNTPLVGVQGDLFIIKNYLLYNTPLNPSQLASWLGCCEELPRSPLFAELYTYLNEQMNGKPGWLFDGLLKPLANQEVRGLSAKFWSRIGGSLKPTGRPKETPPQGGVKVVPNTTPGRCEAPPYTQEQDQEQYQEQYQEQDQDQKQEKLKTKTFVEREEKQQILKEHITDVFQFWQVQLNHPQSKLDTRREKVIRERLKEGYSIDRLKQAIMGIKLSPHHMGKNDRNTVYDDIELICRTGTNVDRFADIEVKQNKPKGWEGISEYAKGIGYDRQRLHEGDAHVVHQLPPAESAKGNSSDLAGVVERPK